MILFSLNPSLYFSRNFILYFKTKALVLGNKFGQISIKSHDQISEKRRFTHY